MLTAEIKINGALIAHVYIVNQTTGSTDPVRGYRYDYKVDYYDVVTGEVTKGRFSHWQNEGAAVCLKKALGAVKKG